MRFLHCQKCGAMLSHRDLGDEKDVPYCIGCDRPFFDFPYPCVICLPVSEDGKILLIKQSYGIERYVLVAGYIKPGESAEGAAVREISEEVGLDTLAVRYLYSRYYEKHDNLMLALCCKVKYGEPVISSEVKEAHWFTVKEAYDRLFEGSYGRDMISAVFADLD